MTSEATVLIVEDDPAHLQALAAALRDYAVLKTSSSLKGAMAAMQPSIKTALIDVRLSDTDPNNRDGVLFAEWLRENFPTTAAVMVTAYPDRCTFNAACDSGAKFFLHKPICVRELRNLLYGLQRV